MKQHLLFDLDLLMDTRIATLSRIDPKLAERAISTDEKQYRERKSNQMEWLGLAPNQFLEAYAKRDIDTLKISRPSYYLFELPTIANQLIELSIKEPHRVEEIAFHINTYPYILDDHQQDLIVTAIRTRLPACIKVKTVYYSPAQLSPSWLKDSAYTGLFMYDGIGWMNVHYGVMVPADKIVQMPSITIHTHTYFENTQMLEEAINYENPQGEKCDPLVGLKVMLAPYFQLEFIVPIYTNIIDLKTYAQREFTRTPTDGIEE